MPCNHEGQFDRRKNQYEKIVNLYLMTKEMGELSHNALNKEADSLYGVIPLGSFNDVCDFNAAHPWLEKNMICSEQHLAFVLHKLLMEDQNNLQKCEDIAFEFGKNHKAPKFNTLSDAFIFYNTHVLDGMPCDETKEFLTNTEDEFSWKKVIDLHEKYYEDVNLSVDYYYTLLNAYVSGLFSESNITFISSDNNLFVLKFND